MNKDRWQLVSRLFEEGVDRPAADRRKLLRETAERDPDLAHEVERLYTAHDGAQDFLEIPAPEAADLLPAPVAERRRIGPYSLLRELATGSTCVVYEAEHSVSGHRVALKVSLGGEYLSERRSRLIQREMRILARLDHPGIAKLYDAGCCHAGMNYFAMEFVEGAPLTLYARRHRLRTEERLRLIMDVCGAVSYAHRLGVIHRDLKPANILARSAATVPAAATRRPGDRLRHRIKLLDFGVARITRSDLDLATVVTSPAEIVGTLAYMSPEQAEGLATLDARSDIYSIGVILYELLTGRLPHDITEMRPVAAVRALCEGKIVAPRKLCPGIDTRLDSIVMRTLERNPARRPESADRLAVDIGRCLRDVRTNRTSVRGAAHPHPRTVFKQRAVTALKRHAGTVFKQRAVTALKRHAGTVFKQRAVTALKRHAGTVFKQRAVTALKRHAGTVFKQRAVTALKRHAGTGGTLALIMLFAAVLLAEWRSGKSGDSPSGSGPPFASTPSSQVADTPSSPSLEEALEACDRALLLHQDGLDEPAEPLLASAAATLKDLPEGREEEKARLADRLCVVLTRTGRLAEAERFGQTALSSWRSSAAAPRGEVADSMRHLAETFEARDRPRKAEALCHGALRLLDEEGASLDPRRSELLVRIALLESRRGDHEHAIATASKAFSFVTGPKDEDGLPMAAAAQLQYARDALVLVLTAAGHTSEAGEILESSLARQGEELSDSPSATTRPITPQPRISSAKSNAVRFTLRGRKAPRKSHRKGDQADGKDRPEGSEPPEGSQGG